MKKMLLLFALMMLSLNTCAPTPTPTAIPTQSPTPTPTLTPKPTPIPLEEIPAVDLGLKGTQYSLPKNIEREILSQGMLPILLDGFAGAKEGEVCAMPMLAQLWQGTEIKPPLKEWVSYGKKRVLWRIEVGDEINCVAVVAKEDNQWGLEKGMVAVLFFQEGESQLLEENHPLPTLWGVNDQVSLTISEDGNSLILKATKPNGDELNYAVDVEVNKVPEMFLQLESNGGGYDLESGIAWNQEGRMIYATIDGEVKILDGVYEFSSINNPESKLRLPYYATMKDFLMAPVDNGAGTNMDALPWGQLGIPYRPEGVFKNKGIKEYVSSSRETLNTDENRWFQIQFYATKNGKVNGTIFFVSSIRLKDGEVGTLVTVWSNDFVRRWVVIHQSIEEFMNGFGAGMPIDNDGGIVRVNVDITDW